MANPEVFEQRLALLAEDVTALGLTVLGERLPLDTLTIFTQNEEEFKELEAIITRYGNTSPIFSHGLTTYIDSDLEVQGNRIRHLGLRRPDSSRPQRGYGDFPVPDLEAMKHTTRDKEYVTFVHSGRGQPMLELRHPDFDVLGYIVAAADH